jgi:hypothetical protein
MPSSPARLCGSRPGSRPDRLLLLEEIQHELAGLPGTIKSAVCVGRTVGFLLLVRPCPPVGGHPVFLWPNIRMMPSWANQRRLIAPEIIQTSAMDCGPASSKCLLEGFGISVSYGRLARRTSTAPPFTPSKSLSGMQVLGLFASVRKKKGISSHY